MDFKPLKYFDSLYPDSTREKELKLLIPFIEKGLSAQIVGLPGSGKSNILRLLAYNKDARQHNYGEYEKYLHFVYIDCAEIKGKNLLDINKFILISLAFTLGERGLLEESKMINSYLKEGLEMNDEMFLFQSFKKSLDYLAIEKKISIHLLFDKFEQLVSTITPNFFTNIRVLRNHAKYRFASIFSLTRPMEDTLDQKLLADIHDLIAGNIIYISIYDPIGIDFRLSYIEKAARIELSKETREKVIQLTGGHAKLAKLSYESLVHEESMPENFEDYLLSRPAIQGALYEIWNALLPSEQKALKSDLPFDQIKSDLPYLADSMLVDQNGITIPLFKKYIESISISKDIISYDETKNEILLGTTPFSEGLSPSEFRLLKYMVQNKEKICTKDEIIEAVWGDQKSYEGVTDQALDQIFYRLRKKIEEDPSNPSHLLTIKGTGYKLVD